MKRFSLFAIGVIFVASCAVSASAQVGQTGGNIRIVVINTSAFDAKDGITKYINAMNALDKEFAPMQTEIQGLVSRYNTLGAEIKKIQDSANAPTPVPIDQNSATAKVEEFKNLETTIKRKQEDGKAKFERRQSEVLGPVLQDIAKAMDEFGKQKDYALILDATKLDSAGLILAVNAARVDVTKEFIAFYNARPAGTATTTAPK
jgi:Skp family chaperone for outer membrane proteins